MHVYWLAYKLIRCAPRHVRADVKSTGTAIDDVHNALTTVRQLSEVESDEHQDQPDGDLLEESDQNATSTTTETSSTRVRHGDATSANGAKGVAGSSAAVDIGSDGKCWSP